uniref:Uncharacterized protein n=1 Tax=Lepeophtheirus salmonis TaxID=72036 RepID=A0A0K2U3M8_LEPSM
MPFYKGFSSLYTYNNSRFDMNCNMTSYSIKSVLLMSSIFGFKTTKFYNIFPLILRKIMNYGMSQWDQ